MRELTRFNITASILLTACLPGWMTWQEWRQRQIDHALFRAIQTHDKSTCLKLLKQGANPNARQAAIISPWWQMLYEKVRGDKNPGLPVLFVAASREPELVPALLNAGADSNTEYKPGYAVLEVAMEEHNPLAIEALVKHSADVNKPFLVTGSTALITAVIDGNIETAQMLLNNHANVNAQDIQGIPPLMYAFAFEHPAKMVSLLLRYGANVNIKTKSGLTALTWVQKIDVDMAALTAKQKAEFEEAIRLLKRAGTQK